MISSGGFLGFGKSRSAFDSHLGVDWRRSQRSDARSSTHERQEQIRRAAHSSIL
jgi:hypothetical protein